MGGGGREGGEEYIRLRGTSRVLSLLIQPTMSCNTLNA